MSETCVLNARAPCQAPHAQRRTDSCVRQNLPCAVSSATRWRSGPSDQDGRCWHGSTTNSNVHRRGLRRVCRRPHRAAVGRCAVDPVMTRGAEFASFRPGCRPQCEEASRCSSIHAMSRWWRGLPLNASDPEVLFARALRWSPASLAEILPKHSHPATSPLVAV